MTAANITSMPCFPHRPTGLRQRSMAGQLAMLVLGLLLLAVSGHARAECDYTNDPGTVTFTLPSTIALPSSMPVGTVLWTSSPTSPTNSPRLNCYGTTRSGIVSVAGNSGTDDTLFPTQVPGLSYRLFYPNASNPLHAYPNQSIPDGNTPFNKPVALQLVATGPIASGSVLAGQLGQWNVDMCSLFVFVCWLPTGPQPVIVFNTSSVTFTAPACTITVDPTVVVLPTVYSSAFMGTGSTTGPKTFNVQLTCPSAAAGAPIAITLAASAPVAGNPGVIAPTPGSGNAQNVGVQILDKNGNPISFGTAIPAGTVTAGNFNIQLNARYFQTGTPVSGGNVKATATYTITYP